MKVLHVTAAGPQAGAGAAALLTHEALLRGGRVESRILFLTDEQAEQGRGLSFESASPIRRLRRLAVTSIDQFPLAFYRRRDRTVLFSPGLIGQQLRRHPLFAWADVVHLHWINHGFIDFREVKKWQKPVVWSMRDMWAFTGGCHHSLQCEGFTESCGRCPILGSASPADLSALVLRHKRRHLPSSSVRWVAISNWLARTAQKSALLRAHQISVVHSGIRTDLFAAIDKREARARLGICQDVRVVLLGANDLSDKYKGLAFAAKTLRAMDPRVLVVAFGRGDAVTLDVPQTVVRLGYIDNVSGLETIYNSADVFFAPSVSEAFGKTVAEAQSCGVPVLAFDETGPADVVEHFRTGYLARHRDEVDLTEGLGYCLTHQFDRAYIRNRTVTHFDIAEAARRYSEIYEEVWSEGSLG